MKLAWFSAAILLVSGAGLLGKELYMLQVAHTLRDFSNDQFCLYNGTYIQGDVPVLQPVSDIREVVHPWSDFTDRHLNAEQAKPFHFGVVLVIANTDGTHYGEFWAWSYKKSRFWREETSGLMEFDSSANFLHSCVDLYRNNEVI